MGGCRVNVDADALVIEVDAHVWITLPGFDHGRVQRRAPDRIDVLAWIDIVGRENDAVSRPCGMDHPAAHRNRVLQYFIRDSDLFERMDPARRKREINRTPADHVSFARIGPAFVKIDLVSAPAQIRGEQSAGQAGADQDKFSHTIVLAGIEARTKSAKDTT